MAALFLFVLLGLGVLLVPLVFVPFFPVFPEEVPDEVPAAVLLFVAGFFVCSVVVLEFCVCLPTPPWAHTAIIPIRETTAAPRSLPQVLVTVVSLFQPT